LLEYETKSTRAFFVTTGYLVRLLANVPEAFHKVTYLIIDEVHERSVDTDILCLLCRRLLHENQNIRLVLMSATLAAAMYQEYFNVSEPVIKVGARRFPVEEVYLGNLLSKVQLPGNKAQLVQKLSTECLKLKCSKSPSMGYMENLFNVAATLATVVGKPGTSVLIFVAGMNDIVSITDIIETIRSPGITYNCLPIHSEIPFEDQMVAFDKTNPNEVKIVIATNAAESSVTLPDVDNVICLGLCKLIEYNPASHRQMLVPTWISRASATQRAGRTGRLRPGTVYRLYERETFVSHMEEFEQGEMSRVPLDDVILTLKEMIPDEPTSDILQDCLEPPNYSTIDRSFQSLFSHHFITSSTDDATCKITQLGHFVSALGIDLALGSLIGLGIQFGVGAEAIQMAGVLSFPKSPWVQSNPLVHGVESFNSTFCLSYVAREMLHKSY
jgi:HrpA-like RNA helicase